MKKTQEKSNLNKTVKNGHAKQIIHSTQWWYGTHDALVACGHSHVARRVRVGSRLVVNPGSIGLPAYDDDAPFPHVMEAGSPHTIYALVSQVGEGADGVVVEHIALPYDHEAAARAAERNQRPDWARWLRTGLAR